ncbi:seipin-1 [Coffea arabica]|uniref:Seipin-1 n=1 Tax=Coffea arabica TaxID=13443 RepID=A0A6P6UED4_COFAR|nr:seipin-1-like [Coffea arabica]
MEEEEEEVLVKNCFPIPNPTLYWFTKLVILQADVFYNCLVVLFSPFLFLLSLISETSQSHYYPPQESKESKLTAESAVHAAAGVPSKLFRGCGVLLNKVFLGFLGAVHVCKILMLLLVVAVILGVGLVRFWAEEPVFIGERLHFDYTKAHPVAAFSFHCDSGCQGYTHQINYKRNMGVPVGHTFYVSLVFLMPESDYNREIGLFQVTAEVISRNGNIMARSSHPCMLRFRSWPIRTMQTFLMGLPLLLGIRAETQKVTVPMLKHKEDFPRTEAIKVTLIPRAGTDFLPQLYEAEILLKSELPWAKELVHRWKWTFYVWTSMHIYVFLLVILLRCSRPLILPVMRKSPSSTNSKQESEVKASSEQTEERSSRDERYASVTLRRWQENRSKRKAMLPHQDIAETEVSSASSTRLTREETGATLEDDDEDDTGDSESVCCW